MGSTNDTQVKRSRPPKRAATSGLSKAGTPAARNGFGREHVVEIQRARILAAMVEVCAEHGAANVTIAHVVERAGVSRRTFYELFNDRDACFLAAFDEAIATARRYVLEADDPQARWAVRIRTALCGLLAFLDVERGAGRLLIVGSLGSGAQALERRRHVLAQITTIIDEGRKETKGGAELPPLTAEGVVGGVLSVLHARLLEGGELPALAGPLMAMIVLPYLGPAAARRELARAAPRPNAHRQAESNPLGRLEIRLTYRTLRVLEAIAAQPGASNRIVAQAAEVADQGQMSKLLARLQSLGLIANTGGPPARGEPNAWTLTERGWRVQGAIAERTSGAPFAAL